MTNAEMLVVVLVSTAATTALALLFPRVFAPAWELAKDALDRVTTVVFGGKVRRARFNEWANRHLP